MQLTSPLRTVTPTLDGPVLHVLARTTYPMTRQQITNLVGDASEAGVRKVLGRLVGQGVVSEQRIGGQYSYTANRDHLAWPGIQAILDAPLRLDARLGELISTWPVLPLSVEIFGSVARGSATDDSDIDLLIYRPTLTNEQSQGWDGQLAMLKNAIPRWTGNECEILDLDAITLVEMVATDAVVLQSPRRHVFGVDLIEALPTEEVARKLWEFIRLPAPSADESTRLSSIERIAGEGSRRRLSPAFRITLDELNRAVGLGSPHLGAAG